MYRHAEQAQILENTLHSDFCIVKLLTLYIYRVVDRVLFEVYSDFYIVKVLTIYLHRVADRGASRRRESVYGAAVCGRDRGR